MNKEFSENWKNRRNFDDYANSEPHSGQISKIGKILVHGDKSVAALSA